MPTELTVPLTISRGPMLDRANFCVSVNTAPRWVYAFATKPVRLRTDGRGKRNPEEGLMTQASRATRRLLILGAICGSVAALAVGGSAVATAAPTAHHGHGNKGSNGQT